MQINTPSRATRELQLEVKQQAIEVTNTAASVAAAAAAADSCSRTRKAAWANC